MRNRGIRIMEDSMHAIILLRIRNEDFFKRYQFIFIHAQMRGDVEICYWDQREGSDKGGLEETLRGLNDRIKGYAEWKLVIYDEWQEGMKADGEMDALLKILSGKKVPADGQCKVGIGGAFPAQLFYVQSREKEYVPLGKNSTFCYIGEDRRFGENVRMLQLEVELGNSRQRSFSGFKLCCALLSLVVGRIPYTFMEAGYLYDLDIEIDQEVFGQYVSMLDERLEQIQICCEREHENLKQRMRNVESFPNVKFPKISLENKEQKEDGKRSIKILSFREMLQCSDIREVLSQNRELLMEQMFYSKGLLHEEGQKIRRTVENMKGTGNFLSEAAKELLQKRINETIHEICAQKDARLEQQKFEEEIYRTERMIEEQSDRLMEKKKRHWILFIFGMLELFITEPYLIGYILSEQKNEWWPACIAVALGTIAVVYLGYYLYLWVLHKRSWGAYGKKICGQLSEYRKNKKIYLENILFLTQKYQYFEKIKREQRQLLEKWNQDREMLGCHVRMLENGKLGLESLLYLTGEEKRSKGEGGNSVKIDFTKEPKEEEYYCLPLQQESYLEINYSGYRTRAGYPFILRMILRKSIRNQAGGDFHE